MATAFEDAYNNYTKGTQGQAVSAMYDANRDANLANMEAEYNRARSQQEADAAQIAGNYRQQFNDLGAQYERQRRNNNVQAAANGLNSGTASQMQLAQTNSYLRSAGQLGAAQAQEQATAARGLADLESAYRSQVNQAVANADYQKAQALLQGYNEDRDRQMQQAQTLAQYGDFSGYGGLMNPEQVAAMTNEYNRRRAIEDEDRAYAREQDAYQRAWNEDERAYSRGWNEAERAYNQARDQLSDQRYADETAYNRAWNEEGRGYERNLSDAQTLASFGDFSGYERLGYSPETVSAMRELWIAQNPDLAYNTGAIDAERYRSMTGVYPPGYQAPSSGGYYGGSSKKKSSVTPITPSEAAGTAGSLVGNALGFIGTRVGNAVRSAAQTPTATAARTTPTGGEARRRETK